MYIRVGCEFRYEATWPTPTVIQVQPRRDASDVAHHIVQETWQLSGGIELHPYHDLYGNLCQRFTMPAGEQVLNYDALVEVSGLHDTIVPETPQVPVQNLPDEALIYTLPSRFCLSDALSDVAWQLFGNTAPGWERVQAINDWVHNNISFMYGTSTPMTTSLDVYERRIGVCRDFAHLAVTICRALNIPARYVFGYIPDIGVPLPDAPMDFCAWTEVYLGDRWWPFDPRNNEPRIGRVLIGRGRDALDVAMVTTYGAPLLQNMTVWADEAPSDLIGASSSKMHSQAEPQGTNAIPERG